MTYLGKVSNGVVLLPPEADLPDGTEVEIKQIESPEKPSSVGERLLQFAGIIKDLPEDFAKNHDHYVHGTPKR